MQEPLAAAFLVPSDRPLNGLPTAFSQRRIWLSHKGLVSRTLKTAQVGDSVFRPTKTSTFSLRNFSLPDTISGVPADFSVHKPSGLDQALDRLVSASSIRYRTSTADLSTL